MTKTILGVGALTLLASAQTTPSLPPTIDGIPGVTGHEGPILFFLGTLVTTLVNLYLQKRNRDWSIADDDRKRKIDAEERARLAIEQSAALRLAAEDVKATAETKARETAVTAKQVAEHIVRLQQQQHDKVLDKIDQNTQVNEQALVAANDINAKILHVKELMATVSTTGGRRAADQAREELSILETALEHHRADTGESAS